MLLLLKSLSFFFFKYNLKVSHVVTFKLKWWLKSSENWKFTDH